MDGKSVTPQEEKLKQLQAILPEAFAEGKVDWEKLRAALGEDVNFSSERYVLNWAGKSDAFKVLQTPSTETLIPVKKESVNFDETGHVFIEGENLEVLKVLQKSYFGKVKMIYTDPPYNTGNDSFVYPDKFAESTEEYQKRIGEKDEDGYMTKEGLFRKNSKENGQYHSNWLNMMYPRLFLAKNLLRQDGVIFVSIDDNEVHNLRLIMNEVFGEENFRNSIIIRRGAKSVQAQFDTWDKLGNGYETVLFYTKNSDYRFPKMERLLEAAKEGSWNNHWRGTDRPTMRYELFGITPETGQWRWGRERSLAAIENYRNMLSALGKTENDVTQSDIDNWYKSKMETVEDDIDLLRLSASGKPEHYIAPTDTMLLNDVWFDFPPHSSSLLKKIFQKKIFDNPKPMPLIQRILDFGKNDIILDFFAGSGTTAHAVMNLNKEDGGNRKFICVQIPELCDEKSEAYKAGYKTIADIAKERIRRVIEKIEQDYAGLSKMDRIKKKNKAKQEFDLFGKDENPENQENSVQNLGFKVFKLADSNFKQWRSDVGKNPEALKQEIMKFLDPLAPNATVENMVYELLLKSGKDLNSKVEHKHNCHCINSSEMILMLEKADEKTVDAVIRENPEKVIALDKLFEGNDQLKTNTALQMRDAGIEFKSI
ncbi:MAG: site-specific DNA-methyltransferase [Desulfococcaceae bacterium]